METNNRFYNLHKGDKLFGVSETSLDFKPEWMYSTIYELSEIEILSEPEITDDGYMEFQYRFINDEYVDSYQMGFYLPEDNEEHSDEFIDDLDTVSNLLILSDDKETIRKKCRELNEDLIKANEKKIQRLHEVSAALKKVNEKYQ